MRVKDLLREATQTLRSAGIEDPRVDAEILLATAMQVPRAHLPAMDATDRKQEHHFQNWIRIRSEQRIPVAYLTEEVEFFGLPFSVSPDVLIPRPETEFLVERALSRKEKRFLDIGTGSGAIAIALASRGLTGIATDTSPEALALAKKNAKRNGVDANIEFLEIDLFAPGEYELVVTNPPYIPTAEIKTLSPEVQHEPVAALDGGDDGLDLIRKILTKTTGPLLMEVGINQSKQITDLALQSGFSNVQWIEDLSGIDRILEAE